MDINQIHPELRKTIRRIPTLPLHNRAFVSVLKTVINILPSGKMHGDVRITESRTGNTRVRIYIPEQALSGAGLLWIHGGGLMIGRAAQDDRLCINYAKRLGLVVVSVDYRLAPRHPFPAAIDDCYQAWCWFQGKAGQWGVDARRIAIGGQSAGGGLAATLAQRIKDRGGIQPAAQTLFCPMLDDRTAADQQLDAIKHRIWNNKSNRAGWSAYLGVPPGTPNVPEYAVPARREDLSGLPPAWIGVGDIDLFHDENRRYGERLQQQGVDCELHIAPMAPHAFETFVPGAPVSQQLFESNYRFLRRVLNI